MKGQGSATSNLQMQVLIEHAFGRNAGLRARSGCRREGADDMGGARRLRRFSDRSRRAQWSFSGPFEDRAVKRRKRRAPFTRFDQVFFAHPQGKIWLVFGNCQLANIMGPEHACYVEHRVGFGSWQGRAPHRPVVEKHRAGVAVRPVFKNLRSRSNPKAKP